MIDTLKFTHFINLNEFNVWSNVLREKLIFPQRLNKFPAFFGKRNFVGMSTRRSGELTPRPPSL